MILIDTISGYHTLKLDFKKSSSLTTFTCPFDRYRFTRLPLRVVLVGDMFQQMIVEISIGLPNVFGTADDILTVGYDAGGKDHNKVLRHLMQICQQETL